MDQFGLTILNVKLSVTIEMDIGKHYVREVPS